MSTENNYKCCAGDYYAFWELAEAIYQMKPGASIKEIAGVLCNMNWGCKFCTLNNNKVQCAEHLERLLFENKVFIEKYNKAR